MNRYLQNQFVGCAGKTPGGIFFALTICLLFLATLTGCNGDVNVLTTTPDHVDFTKDGGVTDLTIKTDAGSWTISNPSADWLTLSATSGNLSTETIKLTVSSRTLTARSADLTISAGNAKSVKVTVSQAAAEHLNVITADQANIQFKPIAETKSLKITTDDAQWSLSSDADWLQFNKTTGTKGATTVAVTTLLNNTDGARTATITVTGANTGSLQIPVTQQAPLYPNYNKSPLAADATGMSSTAVELAAKVHLGWNLGNTLEASGGETAWGNPKTSKALIDLVKQNGFNAVRLPCSWNQYMANSATAELKKEWLDRVTEVVQYCVDNDMYVFLNIHWDGGWLENNCTKAKQEENNAKQRAFWEQIATQLRGFDEHVVFCSANEPNVENAEQMSVLNSYHQTFINAVRSTGGRNSYRVLVFQGPSTDVDKTSSLMTTLPTDQVANRLMAEVHFYTPYQFCLMTEDADWGKMFYYWGANYHSTTDPTRNSTWGEENDVTALFTKMKTKFVDKGIPVVLGEYAAMRRTTLTGDALTLHLASRAYYLKYVTKQAIANGLLPFYWDAGGLGDNGSGLFNRQNNTVFDQMALDAIVAGGAE
jgi:endoglucanase